MPTDEQPLSATETVQDLILDSSDFEEFLNELARFSAHQVAGLGDDALCGITLLRDRKAATIGWSSDSAREVDEIQYSLSQGPCLTAAQEEREIHVPDLHEEERWGPEYASAVASYGLRSVLSLPFNLQGDAKAALNLYSDVPHKFDERATAKARGYTREISQALRLAVRFSLHTDSAANLRATLESRTIIDIAIGIVMAQNRCSQEAAIRILTEASSNSNTKLRDIAKSLVDSVGGSGTRTFYQEPGIRKPEQSA
ncbi:ANTAR domain protein with unknown sensor [Pseudarthrobacter chlorophenolicus A6]|uniref:ANTAR domain-containing protein n=1 Tax=Pseudarthrobacter chlorophenolicus (strain ATCC 700700 / DSM 12829 / CIP 107037 / JCM 12360 / KCTC 9906 / NCIMB 13794 / A6) TaxID=452863 RepID=B8HBG6_PSECP|nr:GAF and ANTAR domain-containing protein [Pseudarthrobacter chlorophenolicus]ACL38651.1 ANTAR domain protein with unknown sensor [Pseudarthrobacter chlorophenolicus A6]SDQ44564.1 GAF domain-containing protein [Pseudarthrobacter chlorophenolicus]